MIIFMCYSSINAPLAHKLSVELGMLGHDVQFEEKFAGGDVGWHQVFESIKTCDLFVFALTQWSSQSYSCHLEYSYAHALAKRILPVQLETIDSYQLPSALSMIPHVDLTAGQETMSVLAQALDRLPSANIPPDILPLYPEFVTPLRALVQQVESGANDENYQRYLFFNLREFLERYDTFNNARDILRTLQSRTSGQIRHEIGATFQQIDELRVQRVTSSRRSRVLRDIALVVGGGVLILLLIRGFIFVRSSFGGGVVVTPTLEDEGSANIALALLTTSTAIPEVAETLTQAMSISIGLSSSTTPTFTVTPVPSQTRTARPDATLTPNRQQTQSAFSAQGTVTSAIATSLAVASSSPTIIPPTATPTFTITPVPTRTNTALPTATFTPDSQQTQNALIAQSTVTSAFATAFAVASSSPTPSPTNTSPPTLPPTSTSIPPTRTYTLMPTVAPTQTPTRIPPTLPTFGDIVYVGILVEDTPQGARVWQASNAARIAGIQMNDIILVVGFDTIRTQADFQRALGTRSAYSTVNFRLRRGEGELLIRITLDPTDFAVATAIPHG